MDAKTASGLWGGLWKIPTEMRIALKTLLRAMRMQNSGVHFGVAYGNLRKKIELLTKTPLTAITTDD
jgi:hypothetical protein